MKILVELDTSNKEHMRFLEVLDKKEPITFMTHAQLACIREHMPRDGYEEVNWRDHVTAKIQEIERRRLR